MFKLDDFGLDLINDKSESGHEVSYFLMLTGEFLSKGDSALVVEVQSSWTELRIAHFLEQVAEEDNIFCALDGGIDLCFGGAEGYYFLLLAPGMEDTGFRA